MARNTTFQPLRGVQANLQSAMPLALGEMYFATDTGNLFFGVPGVGSGYIQLGDMSQMNELLRQLIAEIRASRLALIALACEGGRANPQDFQPEQIPENGLDDSTIQ